MDLKVFIILATRLITIFYCLPELHYENNIEDQTEEGRIGRVNTKMKFIFQIHFPLRRHEFPFKRVLKDDDDVQASGPNKKKKFFFYSSCR